ncbi:SpoIIE family protein phosphatase [Leptospira sp. GIMC2001]|uniref:SpoIIE family protein phosphatase n=1 Tax=Leptospira sp. GIMC2001 TaxID=1513297 RepID=UPI00234BED9F|nr:SpoIIE family protein phosphatase [Leptospira sp. GIMC2001]WCL48222.1 SpoIIE family protein phosphatase [Leptospira sp. GIMC2001]
MPSGKILTCLLFLLLIISCTAEIERPSVEFLDSDVRFESLDQNSNQWVPLEKRIMNFGNNRKPIWIRTKFRNNSENIQQQILEVGVSYLDRIHFYLVKSNSVEENFSGVLEDFTKQKIFHRHPSMRVDLNPREEAMLYIRAENSGLISLPLRLWNAEDFSKKTQAEYMIHGLYYGAMLALLFYNLIIFLSIREKSFLYYCIYLFAVFYSYLMLGGFLKQFFSPEDSIFVKPGLFISTYTSIGFVLLFTVEFLEIKSFNLILDRILRYFAYCCLAMAILSPLFHFGFLVKSFNYLLPLCTIMMIVCACFSYKHGIGQSGFFLLAWVIVTAGVILETLTNLDILPMEFVLGRFGTQLSSLCEAFLFSFAIGRRIRRLGIEKAVYRSKLLVIEKDLEIAKKIQSRILPHSIPKLQNVNIYVHYQPLHAVGGDFYDFHQIDDKHIGVLVADVTGHGVSAAMDSSTVKIAFRNDLQFANSPNKMLSSMNRFLIDLLDYRFVSAVHAYIDMERKEMVYATAGHPPIAILRNNDIHILESTGFLLGMVRDCEYSEQRFALQSKDRIIFYTDGLNGDISIDDTPEDILKSAIEKISYKNPEQFCESVIEELNQQRMQVSDDITVVVVEIL